MGYRIWIFIAALLGACAVAMGAFGAHMAPAMDADQAVWFEKAWRYHMTHVLAMLGTAWVLWALGNGLESHGGWSAHLANFCFLIGIVLFSGVLYLQALFGGGPRLPVVPIGGSAFILGWLLLALSALRLPRF